MGDPVVGPAMGTLKMFIKVGTELYKIHSQFERQMKRLIDTLEIYAPVIQKIEKSNNSKDLEGLKDLKSKLEEGRILIHSCLQVTASQLKKKHSFNGDLDKLIGDLYQRLAVLQTYAIIAMNRNEGAGTITSFRCEPPDPPLFTVGLDKPLHDLKKNFLTRGKSILVLTAPGGFGKTTLATEFCHDEKVKDKFQNNIFFVPVPKYSLDHTAHDDPEQGKNIFLDHIVQQLHQSMHSRLPASSSQIQANAVNKGLRQFLTEAGEKPLLLVFDDVRPGSEFLVDKFHEIKMPEYKILVTSRSDLPRFGSSYYLKSLKKEDARTCFYHFLENKSCDIPTDLKERILEHCKGLPLVIEVVVSSLLREKAVQTWKTMDAKWSRGSILDSVTDLFNRLQTSVDALVGNQAILKQCFIDLGVFLKDQTIPVAALIDMWTELHKLEGEDDESIANLHELTERSFANLVFPRRDKTEVAEDDSYYSQHFVAQHDILRDLAIRQSNEAADRLIIDVPNKSFPLWWTEGMYEQPINARLISISTEGVFPKEWDKMKLPKAEVLVLHFQAESYALPNFLKTMSSSLKVLIVTNHGLLHAKVSKFKLLRSLSNLKRIRLEGISIPSMKKNSREVKSLQKISLFMCNFDQASSKSSINILEAFPNLVEINIDYCNNLKELPAKLCGLVSLKKLSITNCEKLHALPEEIGDLVNLEVLRLLACIKLLQLPGSISKLTGLKLFDLSDCWSIEELSDIGEMHFLKKLGMRHCPGLRTLPQSISNLHQEMDVICDEKTEKLWDNIRYGSNIHIIVEKLE